jgi:hypothetical protein
MDNDFIVDQLVRQLMDLPALKVPPNVIKEYIERDRANVPDSFLPSATRLGVVTSDIFRILPWDPCARWKWRGRASEGEKRGGTRSFPAFFKVRRCGSLWVIERYVFKDKYEFQILCFEPGPVPIVHGKCDLLMELTPACTPEPPENAKWLRWVSTPEWSSCLLEGGSYDGATDEV